VYFPRAIQPLVAPAANLPGFAISLAVVVGLMVVFDVPLRATLLLLPVAMLLVVLLACLFSMLVALLHVYFRDVRYLLQAALLGWFYATPLFYSIDMARRLKPLVIANPLVGAIQLARYALFARAQELGASLVATGAAIGMMTVIALLAYARFDRVAADRM
jgi:ABC-type polysaccharide/polyol phosphate export permease